MDNLVGNAWGVKESSQVNKKIEDLKETIVLNKTSLNDFISDLKLKYKNEHFTYQGNALVHLEQAIKLLNFN